VRDDGNYIGNLPTREHDAPEWQAAIGAQMLVVEHDGQKLTSPAERELCGAFRSSSAGYIRRGSMSRHRVAMRIVHDLAPDVESRLVCQAASTAALRQAKRLRTRLRLLIGGPLFRAHSIILATSD
jgi:hypothetical protein